MTRHAAFTLVELLLAAVTAALLFAAFSALLRGGWVVWARTTDGLEELRRQRAFLERVTQDLANAVAFPTADGAQPSVRFEAQHLQFYTAESPSTDERLGRLWQIEYLVEDAPNGRALVRRARPFDSAATFDTAQRLLTGVERLNFRYGDPDPDAPAGIMWSSVWENEEAMPSYVEVNVEAFGRMPVRHLFHILAGT